MWEQWDRPNMSSVIIELAPLGGEDPGTGCVLTLINLI